MDRLNLIARVFYLKKQELLQLIKEKSVLGRFCGDVYTIEYQKHGLPHMHLLLFLHPKDQIFDAAKIDEIVSADLLAEEDDPTGELFGIISSIMLHGPCGNQNPNAPYIKRSDYSSPQCTKRHPCKFSPETVVQENGYPLYRCQNNGRYHEIPDPQDCTHTFRMDNRWVVPYNPFLSRHFKAHINVEICSSVQAIKYIHKYVHESSDCATVALDIVKR